MVRCCLIVAWGISCTPLSMPEGSEPPPEQNRLALRVRPTETLRIGQQIPHFRLMDQHQQQLTRDDVAGRIVALTFFNTRCAPGSQVIARQRAVQQRLRSDLASDVLLLSVSLDPRNDSPDVLRRYAATEGADRQRWVFASTSRSAVEEFAAAFGVVAWDQEDGSVGHNVNTVVIDRRGRLSDRFPGTAYWDADDLIASIVVIAESNR